MSPADRPKKDPDSSEATAPSSDHGAAPPTDDAGEAPTWTPQDSLYRRQQLSDTVTRHFGAGPTGTADHAGEELVSAGDSPGGDSGGDVPPGDVPPGDVPPGDTAAEGDTQGGATTNDSTTSSDHNDQKAEGGQPDRGRHGPPVPRETVSTAEDYRDRVPPGGPARERAIYDHGSIGTDSPGYLHGFQSDKEEARSRSLVSEYADATPKRRREISAEFGELAGLAALRSAVGRPDLTVPVGEDGRLVGVAPKDFFFPQADGKTGAWSQPVVMASGRDTVNLAWYDGSKLHAVEAKGGGSEYGTRWRDADQTERVTQGSKAYLESIAEVMGSRGSAQHRAFGKMIRDCVQTDRADYRAVRGDPRDGLGVVTTDGRFGTLNQTGDAECSWLAS